MQVNRTKNICSVNCA